MPTPGYFCRHRDKPIDKTPVFLPFVLVSYKAGLATTLVTNFRMVAEYTWSNTLIFMHNIPTTTFESSQYNLGHYLKDNAKDHYR